MKKIPHNSSTSEAPLDQDSLGPGDFISTNQMLSKVPGLMPFTSGTPSNPRYSCATIFVDSATQYIYFSLQESTNAITTVTAKESFEAFSCDNDVHTKHYRCDNGVYQSKHFTDHVRKNGIAERYIGVLTRKTRTMLLHAMSRWPSVVEASFWSFAWQLAVHQHNHLPKRGATCTRYESFTLTDDEFNPQPYHTFGCPTYVLDPALADGKPVPKWSNRCYLGVYVRLSPNHSSNVAVVFNPMTKLVSPAYHCVFDDRFTTVSNANTTGQTTEMLRSLITSLLETKGSWHHHDAYSTIPSLSSTPDDTVLSSSVGRDYHGYNPAYTHNVTTLHKRKLDAYLSLRQAHLANRRVCKKLELPMLPLPSKDLPTTYEGVYPATEASTISTSLFRTSVSHNSLSPFDTVPLESTTEGRPSPMAIKRQYYCYCTTPLSQPWH